MKPRPSLASAPFVRTGTLVLGSILGWSIVGLFIAMFLATGEHAARETAPWRAVLAPTAQYLAWWALLTPVLLRVSGVLALVTIGWNRGTFLRVAALAGAVVLTAIAQLLGYAFTAEWWAGVSSVVDLPEPAMFFVGRFRENVLVGALIVGAQQLWYRRHQAAQRELEAARLAAQLSESRLQALSMELQPHFLFNTLNAIAGMVWQDPAKADAMVLQLSDLLRRTLEAGSSPTSTLAEEREVLELYLGIQQVRFGDRLTVTVDLPPSLDDTVVPRFLLQPLVENAFQHGLAGKRGPISLVVEARGEGEHVVVRILDDGVGLKPAEALVESTGVGNMRRRLAALYAEGSSLSLANRPTGGAEVRIVLPRRLTSPLITPGVADARVDRR